MSKSAPWICDFWTKLPVAARAAWRALWPAFFLGVGDPLATRDPIGGGKPEIDILRAHDLSGKNEGEAKSGAPARAYQAP
jgi:hypothetical protein